MCALAIHATTPTKLLLQSRHGAKYPTTMKLSAPRKLGPERRLFRVLGTQASFPTSSVIRRVEKRRPSGSPVLTIMALWLPGPNSRSWGVFVEAIYFTWNDALILIPHPYIYTSKYHPYFTVNFNASPLWTRRHFPSPCAARRNFIILCTPTVLRLNPHLRIFSISYPVLELLMSLLSCPTG